MSETRIVFNSDGFRQILQSEGCKEAVQQVTDNIKTKEELEAFIEELRRESRQT